MRFECAFLLLRSVVFVHGLTGAWDKTWTGTSQNGQNVLWPKEILGNKFPDARISSFGYDVNAEDLRKRVSSETITQHANNLLVELEILRRETDSVYKLLVHYKSMSLTPHQESGRIIFAVHSLGGLLVQEALNLSKTNYQEHMRSIERATLGVVFFGTPLMGADLTSWAKIGNDMASLINQTDREIVGILQPTSEMADRIRRDIRNLVENRRQLSDTLYIACFYEALPVHKLGRVIVEKESATWYPHYSKGIHADHMAMTKFASHRDQGYRDFVGEIGRWLHEASRRRFFRNSSSRASPNSHSLGYGINLSGDWKPHPNQYVSDTPVQNRSPASGTSYPYPQPGQNSLGPEGFYANLMGPQLNDLLQYYNAHSRFQTERIIANYLAQTPPQSSQQGQFVPPYGHECFVVAGTIP